MNQVSVIISLYNRAHLLRKALISLAQQSSLPTEIIISDDGSDEDVMTPIQEIVSRFTIKVKYVRQEHRGFRLAKCRNNGVRASSGDYLIFLDQDLVFTKYFLKTFIDHRQEKRFCVAYPVRLTKDQTDLLDDATIMSCDFQRILKPEQIRKIEKQYRKDKLYTLLKQYRLRRIGPKLRGGVAAVHREDYLKVNGYDENYQAWGSEDDDLGRRLYQAGIHGINPFHHEFPLHLHHEPFHDGSRRANQEYHRQRSIEIRKGNYRCEFGIDHPLGDEASVPIDLN